MRYILYFILIPALLPVFLIFKYIYGLDKVEREPMGFVLKVLLWGAVFSIPCAVVERFAISFIQAFYDIESVKYAFMENTFGVALVEELSKWLVLMILVWRNNNFDYRYDGIVYAVFVGMGFAIFENIKYVLEYGMVTGILRALTAIPGHCAFAIIMGTFYGSSKYFQSIKNKKMQVLCMLYAIIIPIVGHGLYDFALTISNNVLSVVVSIFYMIILDIFSLVLLLYQSKHDQFIVGSARPRQVNPQAPQNQLQPTQMNSGYINPNDYGNYVNPTNVVPNMYDPNDFQRR